MLEPVNRQQFREGVSLCPELGLLPSRREHTLCVSQSGTAGVTRRALGNGAPVPSPLRAMSLRFECPRETQPRAKPLLLNYLPIPNFSWALDLGHPLGLRLQGQVNPN